MATAAKTVHMKSSSVVQAIGVASFTPKKINYFLVEAFYFIFLISLPTYLYLTGIWGVGPKYIFFISFLFLFFVPLRYPSILPLWPFFVWHVSLLLVATFSFLWNYGPNWATSGVLRLLGGCFITSMAVVIGVVLPPNRLMRAICFSTIITALICCIDLVFPMVLEKRGGEIIYFGRAAGLFLNANEAGAAIALGFLASCSWVDKKWFYLFFLISVLGLLATVSRSAMLCFLGALIFMKFPSLVFSTRFKVIVTSIFAVIILTGAAFYVFYADWQEVSDTWNLWLRLIGGRAFGLDGEMLDDSAIDRFVAAREAWNAFGDFPLFGVGVGSTRMSEQVISSHNMYLTFAAELGVIGVLLIGCYFMAAYYSMPSSHFRSNARVVLVFLGLYFLFTHNHFDDYFPLLVVGTIIGSSLHFSGYSTNLNESVFGSRE